MYQEKKEAKSKQKKAKARDTDPVSLEGLDAVLLDTELAPV
jgi:hypothetical protein